MTEPQNKIKLFESQQVRTEWDAEAEKWWISVVDAIQILSAQPSHDRARKYWSVLKTRMKQEGAQPTTICSQLKMQAPDGKMRLTDVADTAQMLRIVQSVPSPKAEPFKQWLAQVGSERLDETVDPELSIDRAIQNYRRLGYSENWMNQRIKSIEVRKALMMSEANFLSKLLDGVEVEWKALGELGNLVGGNGLQEKDFTETGVPAIHYGQIYTYYGLATTETKSFVSPDLAKQLKKVDKGDVVITNTS